MSFKRDWQGGGTSSRGKPPGKPLADYATRLLSPIVERRAGMTLDLRASWEDLVGPAHAARSRPERLKWPRGGEDEFAPATLVVACEGSHAVFLQHDTRAILERLNAFFGFAAVDRVQVVQRPVEKRDVRTPREAPRLPPGDERSLRQSLDAVDDEALRAALLRLGRGVRSQDR